MGRKPGGRTLWSNEELAAARTRIKAELDAAGDGRLELALKRVREVEDIPLDRYIYIVSALVHHERQGGLDERRINQLAALGEAILLALRVDPGSARLAHLYGDLHQTVSLIHRKAGRHWEAAWEQQRAARCFKADARRGEAFRALGFALRALRLGEGALALENYAIAEAGAADARQRFKARIGRAKAARLSGQPALAESLLFDAPELDDAERRELEWERRCLAAQRGELGPLLSLVSRRGEHRGVTYTLEAWLWAHAVPLRRWREHVAKPESILRRDGDDARKVGILGDCVQLVATVFDTHIPFERRVDALGRAVAMAAQVLSIEHELLILIVGYRWIASMNAPDLAALVRGRYAALSRSLSSGASDDVLGLLGAPEEIERAG
jgi:hypothetical protein